MTAVKHRDTDRSPTAVAYGGVLQQAPEMVQEQPMGRVEAEQVWL